MFDGKVHPGGTDEVVLKDNEAILGRDRNLMYSNRGGTVVADGSNLVNDMTGAVMHENAKDNIVKPTSDMQNYEYAKQKKGIKPRMR